MIGLLCRVLGHAWAPHPDFEALNRQRTMVRRCGRCPQVQTRAFDGGVAARWRRLPHLERRR